VDLIQRVEEVVNRTVLVLETADEGLARRTLIQCRRIHQEVLQAHAVACACPTSREALFIASIPGLLVDLDHISDLAASLCEQALLRDETGIVGDIARYRRLGEDVARTLRRLSSVLQGTRFQAPSVREDAWVSEHTVEGMLQKMARHAVRAVRNVTCWQEETEPRKRALAA